LVLKAASGTVELAAGLIRYLAAHYPDAKTVLNIMPDDGAIAEVGPKVAKFVEDAGLTMAGDTIGWSLDTVDFYPIAQKCIARNADAWLINPGYEAMVAQFLRAGREQGYTGVVTGTSGAFHNLLQVSGDDPNVCTGIFLPGFSVQSVEEVRALPDDMFTPLFKQIGEKAITEYGFYDPDLLKGFDCLYCLVQAIEEAQSFDPEVVAATWKTMDTMETSWGPGRMCGIETFGVNNVVGPYRPIQIIENGVMTYGGMVDMSIP
jgi:ABC-type branched-subunit amino acid transport system substrate-binding protein